MRDAERANDPFSHFECGDADVPFLRRVGRSRSQTRVPGAELKMVGANHRVIDKRCDGGEVGSGPTAEGHVGDGLKRNEGAVVQQIGVIEACQCRFGQIVRTLLKCLCENFSARKSAGGRASSQQRDPPWRVPSIATTLRSAKRAPTAACAKYDACITIGQPSSPRSSESDIPAMNCSSVQAAAASRRPRSVRDVAGGRRR